MSALLVLRWKLEAIRNSDENGSRGRLALPNGSFQFFDFWLKGSRKGRLKFCATGELARRELLEFGFDFVVGFDGEGFGVGFAGEVDLF